MYRFITDFCMISIHALREEGDTLAELQNIMMRAISIHALREEGDPVFPQNSVGCEISIHALREEGDKLRSATLSSLSLFLSTPSARRATEYLYRSYHTLGGFLSTPSARRATHESLVRVVVLLISIHALREEGDRVLLAD